MNYKQKAILNAKVIDIINKHEPVTNEVISKVCKDNGANECFIRIVGGWKKLK